MMTYIPLFAADETVDFNDYGSEQVTEASSKLTPFFLNARADYICDSTIKDGFYEKDPFKFATVGLELGFVFYYNPVYTEGSTASIGYNKTRLSWTGNPWFDQQQFSTATLTFTGFSSRFNHWNWKGQLTLTTDADEWSLSDYTYYDTLLWGRYCYNPCLGFHIGFLLQTGMKMNQIYPILGFDWQMHPLWKLNVVFPVNLSLEYQFRNCWSLALAIRNFDNRFRVGKEEAHSQSLIRYRNVGNEIAIKYETKSLFVNIHAGYTWNGKFRVANNNNQHAAHYKLKPSAYYGAEAVVKF
jgi:hypothetical protein